MSTLVDLSHPLHPEMPAYPGLPRPQFRTWMTHVESADRGAYASGTTFQIGLYELAGSTGTYVDAPFHRYPHGMDMAHLPLEKLANLEGIVVTARNDGAIGPEVFHGLDLRSRAVLVRTDWAQRWGGPDYFRSGPFLTADACQFLIAAQAALVGIDCANVDDMQDASRPAHTILLREDIPVVEHLCNLDQLPISEFRFFAVPPAIADGASFPVRAFALINQTGERVP